MDPLILAVVISMVGALVLWTAPNPDAGCDDCPHCRKRRLDRAAEQSKRVHDAQHHWNPRWDCGDPGCDRRPPRRPG